jgi:hypothetical protein
MSLGRFNRNRWAYLNEGVCQTADLSLLCRHTTGEIQGDELACYLVFKESKWSYWQGHCHCDDAYFTIGSFTNCDHYFYPESLQHALSSKQIITYIHPPKHKIEDIDLYLRNTVNSKVEL